MAFTESINVKPVLKRFLENMKIKLKEDTGEFYSIPATLMKYLEGNEEFMTDFRAYCDEKRKENIGVADAKKILEQDNGELLSLLTK